MGRYVSIGGVIVGGIADIVLSIIFFIPLVIVLMLPLMQGGHVPQTVIQAGLAVSLRSPGVMATTYLIGALGSIAGGFIAALIAKREELLNGLLSAWICAISGIFSIFTSHDVLHVLLALIGIPLSGALGVAGGYLRYRMVQPKSKRVAV